MKKLFLISLALFTMTAVQAQLKVIPTLKKGMEKVYETKMTMIMPGQPAINLVSDTKYTVSDATADGYIIDVVTTTFSSDASKDNITGQIMTAAQEMVKDVNIRIATDKNGKPVKIANYEELSKKVNERGKLIINKIYELVPAAKEILPEDALFSNLAAGHQVAEMPNASAHPDLAGLINNSSGMYKIGHSYDYWSSCDKIRTIYWICSRSSSVCIGRESTHWANFSETGKSPVR